MEIKIIMDGIEEYLRQEHTVNMVKARTLVTYLSKRVEAYARKRSPVLTGELVGSLSNEPIRLGKKYGKRIVFRAKHALKVHEEPQSKRRTGESRFLVKSENEAMDTDFDVLKEQLFGR